MNRINKTLFVFEGLGCSGKTTLIKFFKEKNNSRIPIEILDKFNVPCVSNLYSPNININVGKYGFSSMKWARIFMYLNYMFNSKSNLFLLDRGILTNYIHDTLDEIPNSVLNGLIQEFLMNIKNVNYVTFYLKCNIDEANRRLKNRKDLDIDYKICRNALFEPYYNQIETYPFLGKIITIDTSKDIFLEYSMVEEAFENLYFPEYL